MKQSLKINSSLVAKLHSLLKERSVEVKKRRVKSDLDSPLLAVSDSEECLRRLMVTIIPKIRENRISQRTWENFFRRIMMLKEVAMTDDPRFLDAWNCCYETVSCCLTEPADYQENLQIFFYHYQQVLQWWVERLEMQL